MSDRPEERTDALVSVPTGEGSREDDEGGKVRANLLANLSDRAALDMRAQETQSSGFHEPRILRLLKILDPPQHASLTKELGAILTSLRSNAVPEVLKAKLREQLRKTVEARVGPAFKRIGVAEAMLSNGKESFYLDSAAAALTEMPSTLREVPDQKEAALTALRLLTALRAFRGVPEASNAKLEKLYEKYILEKLTASGCQVKLIQPKDDQGREVKMKVTCFAIPSADLPKLRDVISAAEEELGIGIIVKDRQVMGVYHPSTPEECRLESDMGRPDNVRAGWLWFVSKEYKATKGRHWEL